MNRSVADDQNGVRVPLGGDYWTGDPGTPLWGFADLHAHLMAHLAFGGKAFWGRPYDPDYAGLVRCTAGPRRDYDINLDGMAHYGLLPDFLQDLRNSGLSPDDLAPLFGGANDYVEVWAKCVAHAKEIRPPATLV